MRRLARILGTLLIVAGVGVLAWSFIVWRWDDPFTSVYTRYEQHKLEAKYKDRLDRFRASPRPASDLVSAASPAERVSRAARHYRRGSRAGDPIGRIKVPRLDLNMVLVNGTDHDSLTKGPGRDARTFMPGEGQLVYIAGHRTTYSAPFSHIDRLRRRDLITIELPYASFVYAVTRHVIVPADDIARLRSHGREVLALQACHPRFFATQRYIVYATGASGACAPRPGSPR